MKYYVTTSIPYVNGDPHIGFGMELLQADVLARYARQRGDEVIYSTGTDEHGGKISEKAKKEGLETKAYTDKISAKFHDLTKSLNISNDRFIRTTDPGHEQRAALIWEKLKEDIYKDSYTGLYCTGCEAFVTEAIAKENDGICPNHTTEYEKIEEENYFFKLSKYTKQILEAIESEKFNIIPLTRRNEITSLLREGLDDISISRPKDKIEWGIAVPGDESQVMYVWFEALMNYITVLGYPENDDFKNYWPASVQVIGKDIIRFHAAIWPGVLLALGLELPTKLYVHGFINVEGQKMSKSIGNVLHPDEIIEKYGVDATRYYFLRHIPSYEDGDFSWDRMHNAYTNELGNELGNAVQRTAAMINQYQGGVVGELPENSHDTSEFHQAIDECRFDKALDSVWGQVRGLNQYIEEEKPWQINKEGDAEHLREILAYQVSSLLAIGELLSPFMPEVSEKIVKIFENGRATLPKETLFPRVELDG